MDTQITESGTYITFNPYMEGMAPALIINHTENYLKFIEHDLSEYLDEMLVIINFSIIIFKNIIILFDINCILFISYFLSICVIIKKNFFRKILPPRHKMFFAWSTPTDNPILYWNMMQDQADLRKVC